jgi:hypothetical protein
VNWANRLAGPLLNLHVRNECRLTSRISDGTPSFKRNTPALHPEMIVGRVHFVVTRALHAVVRRIHVDLLEGELHRLH